MLSVYRMFRSIYSVNARNEQSLFTISKHLYSAKALAAMAELEAEINALASGEDNKKLIPSDVREGLNITTETLSADYPQHATSLLNLVQNSENKIK